MRSDYPPLDIDLVFSGLGEIILLLLVVVVVVVVLVLLLLLILSLVVIYRVGIMGL